MRRCIITFFVLDVVFIFLYVWFHGWGNPFGADRPVLFDLNDEESLPTWYSSFKLLCVGLAFYFYGRSILTSDTAAGAVILLLALSFFYLSIDEGNAIHERIAEWVDHFITGGGTSKETLFAISGYWMFILGPPAFIFLVGSCLFIKMRLGLRAHVLWIALLGLAMFIGAATTGDILLNFISDDRKVLQALGEEGFEMLGVTLLAWAAGRLLADEKLIVLRSRE